MLLYRFNFNGPLISILMALGVCGCPDLNYPGCDLKIQLLGLDNRRVEEMDIALFEGSRSVKKRVMADDISAAGQFSLGKVKPTVDRLVVRAFEQGKEIYRTEVNLRGWTCAPVIMQPLIDAGNDGAVSSEDGAKKIKPQDGTLKKKPQDAAVDGCPQDVNLSSDGQSEGPLPIVDGLADQGTHSLGQWVKVLAGSFVMGSQEGEPCRKARLEKTHQVRLTRPFEIYNAEVTRAQFRSSVTKVYPKLTVHTQDATCEDCPAEVLWSEAATYCNELSKSKKLPLCYYCYEDFSRWLCKENIPYIGEKIVECPGYRLPTEAEWEYAYRAGSQEAFYNGPIASCSSDKHADAIGWYSHNTKTLKPGGQRIPNAWGIFDMAGNAAEWCTDFLGENAETAPEKDPVGTSTDYLKAIRGGKRLSSASGLRAASRQYGNVWQYTIYTGFRCVRTL